MAMQVREIMRALEPRLNDFLNRIEQRIEALSAIDHRTLSQERELRAAMGFQAISDATGGKEGVAQFARWAIHDGSGFLFQTQQINPLHRQLALALQKLLPELLHLQPTIERDNIPKNTRPQLRHSGNSLMLYLSSNIGKAKMTVIEPLPKEPTLDIIAQDMVMMLEKFYKEKPAPMHSARGRN